MLSSSSDSGCSPAPTRKRKRVDVEPSDGSASDSDASSADEDNAPRRSMSPTEEDTVVLSHAERRRQQKKQKQRRLIAASSKSPQKTRSPADDTPSNVHLRVKAKVKAPPGDDPRRQKRRHSVWVGNLSFRTTQDALRGFFDGVGTITRVHMPLRSGLQMHGENMGFAYVDFDTPDAKVTAITLSEGQLDGRHLLIKDGDDFAGRPTKAKTDALDAGGGGSAEGETPVRKGVMADGQGLSRTAQKIVRMQKQPPAPTLFLGNLGFETTEESIRELFEAHRYWGRKGEGGEGQRGGEGRDGAATSKDVWIRQIRMGTFEDSGACKGFAFVDFTSIEHATAALVNPRNHRLNGRDLVVEYASPDAVRRGGGPRHAKGDQDRKNRHGNARTPQKDTAHAPYHTKQRRPRHIVEQADGADVAAEATTTRPQRPDRDARRAKPGAALAHAQRQSAAILPSQGQKIVF